MGSLLSCISDTEPRPSPPSRHRAPPGGKSRRETLTREEHAMAAAAAMLLQQNGISLPFDRSSSLRYPPAAAGQKKQALPQSSSSRARSLTDPLVPPQQLVNQKWDSTVENTMKKGTPIMAVPCVNAEGWCLSGDTLFTITDPVGPETFITGLKVAKVNDRFVALVAENMGIAEIFLLEVRAYLPK